MLTYTTCNASIAVLRTSKMKASWLKNQIRDKLTEQLGKSLTLARTVLKSDVDLPSQNHRKQHRKNELCQL